MEISAIRSRSAEMLASILILLIVRCRAANISLSIKTGEIRLSHEFKPLVATAEGIVRGLTVESDGIKYYSFLGMPYAEKPPRFEKARSLNRWNGTKDAFVEGNMCVQKDIIMNEIRGSEDCLYLNVYTPTTDEKYLPVIFWIHGGAFKSGSGSMNYYGPQRLLKEQVVVVSVNYRLGPLGFLSTGTNHAPGNVGLKDIVEALRWVGRNIHMFGGDPYNVCIYGVSSGAMIVEYLTLSPAAAGLFSKAISHSGSALTDWAFNKEPMRNAFKLGQRLGLKSMDLDDLMRYLNNASSHDLIKAQEDIINSENPLRSYLPFVPCAEPILPGSDAFLSDYPENILKSGRYNRVPLMMGYNNREGLYFLESPPNITKLINGMNKIFELTLPTDLSSKFTSPSIKSDVINQIKRFYVNGTLSLKTVEGLVNYLSDTKFLYGINKSVMMRSQNLTRPLYYYEFAYDQVKHKYNISGVAHTEDMLFVFAVPIIKERFESLPSTKRTYQRMVKLITNFVKFGNPTPRVNKLLPITWSPVDRSKLNYLMISKRLEMRRNPYKDRYEFWSRIYSKK